MTGFVPSVDGARASFSPTEAALIADLARQLSTLVSRRETLSPEGLRHDVALARLLPDAYSASYHDNIEFRQLTEAGLAEDKIRNAILVSDTLGGVPADLTAELDAATDVEVELDGDQVQAWLRTLTDIRLVLAARVGIIGESEAAARDEDPQEVELITSVYGWLGELQSTLVDAIDEP